jgi:tRNA-splicing ligase RtcB
VSTANTAKMAVAHERETTMSEETIKPTITPTSEATAILPARDNRGKPITVIGTQAIREGFDARCLEQALNSRSAPGVSDLILNPDAHVGYGAPVGSVLVSPTHIYPGPVGVDIKCSMSLLQLDLPGDAIKDKKIRRELINAIVERTPTGSGQGQRSARKSRKVSAQQGRQVAIEGASPEVCESLGIPPDWATRCEDAFHLGHDNTRESLESRLDMILRTGRIKNFEEKVKQLGSYGGGNHFGEAEIVHVGSDDEAKRAAEVFGLRDGHVAFLSHCGSRGFGNLLAQGQFRDLQTKFSNWAIPLPGNDRELVYAPLSSPEADAYIDDMSLGANFATINHLLINALVLEASSRSSPAPKATSSTSSPTTSPARRSSTIAPPGSIAKAPPAPSPPATMPSPTRPSTKPATQSCFREIPRPARW